MPRKSALGSRTTDSHVVDFLSEFANYLIAAGTSNSKFAYLSKIAFFRAASESALLRNRRVNQSAVAAMTGLTRVQVRAMAKQDGQTISTKRDRTENVIAGWMSDVRFLRADLSPRRLAIGRGSAGFSELVRRYGGDVTPRAMLRELVRNKHASVKNNYAQLDVQVSETRAQARLRQVSESMAALLRDAQSNSGNPQPLQALNFEVLYPATSAKGRILLQKRFTQRMHNLLTEFRIAGEAASSESPPSRTQKKRVTRTRVVLVTEDLAFKNDSAEPA
jgi:5-carboxymethyl-2-hydroxymuconate isomerase